MSLYCIYKSHPDQIVFEMEGDRVIKEYKIPGPRWAWGDIRGGTTPIPYKGALLRFFHSALDYDILPNRRRYFVGAMTMEDKPPFKPVAISRRPILWGSELDTLSETERSSALQYKTKVIFPLGAVQNGPGTFLLLACGKAGAL
jgi:predicted GH43/DUF377 family glycosyl hydrolase